MAVVPVIRCSRIRRSVDFYTRILDFTRADDDDPTDPAHVMLRRAGDLVFLSSHTGDGEFGQHVVVMCVDVDALFKRFVERGLVPPDRESPIHHGPVEQSWGTKDFAVDDPDGNTIIFSEPL